MNAGARFLRQGPSASQLRAAAPPHPRAPCILSTSLGGQGSPLHAHEPPQGRALPHGRPSGARKLPTNNAPWPALGVTGLECECFHLQQSEWPLRKASGWGFRVGVPGMRSRNAIRNAEFWVSRAFPFRVPRSVETRPALPSQSTSGAGLRRLGSWFPNCNILQRFATSKSVLAV